MIVWLFNESLSKPIINGLVRITSEDLEKFNETSWQKFRNIVDRTLITNFFDELAWTEFDKRISEFNRKKRAWICRCCKKSLSQSKSILCDRCLDWIHLPCVGLSSVPRKKIWMCPDCADEN